MTLLVKYRTILAALLILVGFSQRALLYHNYEYWNVSSVLSLLFIVLGGAMFHSQFEQLFPKLKKVKKWFSRVIGIVWSASLMIAFIYLGEICNYQLWKYYTQNDYVEAWGKLSNEESFGATREEKVTFYLVEFLENGKKRTLGVPISYLDSNLESKLKKNYGTALIKRNLKSFKVKMHYSKKHPSYMNIVDSE